MNCFLCVFFAVSALQTSPLEFGGVTFQPGLRLQPRYEYNQQSGSNDIFLRRTRLKAKGNAFDVAQYYFEMRIDGVGQQGVSSTARVETAYLDFAFHPIFNLRVGQYDVPFSRNSLTSDSKLLLMDRSLITGRLSALGLADNTQGALIYGKLAQGVFEYKAGVFDNEVFENSAARPNAQSTEPMIAGRVAFNFLDARDGNRFGEYRGSYIGKGRRLSFGANATRLGNVQEDSRQFDVASWGLDAFANYEQITFQAEADWFREHTRGHGWYMQAGYVLPYSTHAILFEPAIRYQRLETNRQQDISETSLGLNIYIKDHNLKLQTEYRMRNDSPNDVFLAQLQFDF